MATDPGTGPTVENAITATRVRGQAVGPGIDEASPEQTSARNTAVKLNQRRQTEQLRDDARLIVGLLPGDVAAKYLKDGNKYYFANKDLAFVDKGTTLTTHTLNQSVIQDIVKIAKARGWEEARVDGAPQFRQAVWKEAFAEGITVKGYEPTALDQQQAAAERARRQAREGAARASGVAGPAAQASGTASPAQAPNVDPAQGVVYGKLLEHGAAPYLFDPKKSASYYVKLDVGTGDVKTYWGKGLPEALQDSRTRPAIGDTVGVEKVGARGVTVEQESVDKVTGQVVTRSITAQRNVWVVEHPGYFLDTRTMAADVAARAERNQPAQRGAAAAASMASSAPATNVSDGQDRHRVAEARQVYENPSSVVPGRNIDPAKGVVLGKLVEHGIVADPRDPKAAPTSYYLKLDVGNGVIETYKGQGLAEALRESCTRRGVGDEVGVMIAGHRLVDPAKPKGEVISTWIVEDPRYFRDTSQVMKDLASRDQRAGQTTLGSPHTPFPARDDQGQPAQRDTAQATPNGSSGPVAVSGDRVLEHAAAVRNAALTREELQRQYPDISAAVFSQLAAQEKFADAYVKNARKMGYDMNAGDRDQVIQRLRNDLAGKIERGDTIKDVGVEKAKHAATRAVARAYDEVGRAPRAAAPDRSVEQVRVPKTLVREDFHVRG